jgi:uncharacterized membrane protein (Fun14 family)
MSIIQLPTILPAQVGIVPQMKRMVTTDNLATITAAGYLNSVDLQSNPIASSDVLDVLYSYNQQTNSGTFGIFTVSISNGVITLVQWANPGDVLLPVVSGDFANFNGTTGQIFDAGYSATDATKTKVVMLNAAPTINHVAIFTNANGTIGDGGVLGTAAAKAASDNTKATLASINAAPTSGHVAAFTDNVGTIGDGGVLGTAAAKAASDNTKATLASVSAATILGNLAKFSDTAGTVADQGIAFKSVAGASVAGGAAAQTITDAFCTSGSCVVATWNTQANAVSILKVVPGNGSFVVTSSGDPGASTLNYIITK